MGFLEDMIKTIQESAEEARRQDQSRNADSAPAPQYPTQPPPQAQRERQAARVNRRVRDSDPPMAIPQTPPAPPRAPVPPPPPKPEGASSAERFRRLLQQPRTIRELMVLSEILGPPRAHRPLRRLFGGGMPPAPPAPPAPPTLPG